jgi:hypothetical protein
VRYRAPAIASAAVGRAARKMIFRFICYLAHAGELIQQPEAPVDPAEERAPLTVTESENAPVTGHGGADADDGGAVVVDRGVAIDGTTGDTNRVETAGGGLSPALPSSVEPNGIAARPTLNVDSAGIDEPTLPVPAQSLDAAPAMPPPSNSAAADCDVGPAPPEQPIVPIAEDGAGLVPGVVISVAPSGMPAGATAMPGPMASGDVAPSGDGPTPTCAKADAPPRRDATRVAITKCIFMDSTFSDA